MSCVAPPVRFFLVFVMVVILLVLFLFVGVLLLFGISAAVLVCGV